VGAGEGGRVRRLPQGCGLQDPRLHIRTQGIYLRPPNKPSQPPIFQAKPDGFDENFVTVIRQFFPVYTRRLRESGSGYLLPSGITWPDFVVADFFDSVRHAKPTAFEDYPELAEFYHRLSSLPQLAGYLDGRKQTAI